MQEVFHRVDDLARFPFLGRPSENPEVKEFVVDQRYLISYRVSQGRVEILQVWHVAQTRGSRCP